MTNAERIFWGAIIVYVAVLPISGTTAIRSLAFTLLITVTVWQALRGGLRLRFPLLLPWAVYAAVAVASVFYAADPKYSLGEIKKEILYPFIVLVVSSSWINSTARLYRLGGAIVFGSLLFVTGSAWSALDAILSGRPVLPEGLGPWRTGVGDTATAVVTAMPWLVVLAVMAGARYRRRQQLALLALCFANLGVLILTMNRQAWLAIALSFAVATVLVPRSFWNPQRLLTTVAVGGLLVVAFTIVFSQRQGSTFPLAFGTSGKVVAQDVRWPLWRFATERITERPWTGGGFGREAFKLEFSDYHEKHPLAWHAHNMVMNKGVQMGMPGIFAFLLLWVSLVRACVKGLREAALRPWFVAALAMAAGVFMRNMADDFFIRNHALMFWLICGACLGALTGEGRHEKGAT